MENGPFEDVFPIEHGDIPASYVSLLEVFYPDLFGFQHLGSRNRPPKTIEVEARKTQLFGFLG